MFRAQLFFSVATIASDVYTAQLLLLQQLGLELVLAKLGAGLVQLLVHLLTTYSSDIIFKARIIDVDKLLNVVNVCNK